MLLGTCFAVVVVGCVFSRDWGDAVEQPEFLTPVAEAQQAGLRLYWLGEEFEAGPLTFQINGYARYSGRPGEAAGLKFEYGASTGRGNVAFDLNSYPKESGVAEARREEALRIAGAASQDARVGPWEGELVTLPLGTRPVNQRWLFLDVGETVVVGRAGSGGPGIPGQDANPLIDSDLLIQVMEEHLRPYPE